MTASLHTLGASIRSCRMHIKFRTSASNFNNCNCQRSPNVSGPLHLSSTPSRATPKKHSMQAQEQRLVPNSQRPTLQGSSLHRSLPSRRSTWTTAHTGGSPMCYISTTAAYLLIITDIKILVLFTRIPISSLASGCRRNSNLRILHVSGARLSLLSTSAKQRDTSHTFAVT